MSTRATAATMIGLLLLALTGCATPDPPQATPTAAFSSDAEAFAAAEETYRAYVDAVNARREDPSAPNPQEFLIGAALESDAESGRRFDELGVHLQGPTTLSSFVGETVAASRVEVVAAICIDSATARLIDGAGDDVTPAGRDATQGLTVTFVFIGQEFMITESQMQSDDSC